MYTELRCLRCYNSGLYTKQIRNILKKVVPFANQVTYLADITNGTQLLLILLNIY